MFSVHIKKTTHVHTRDIQHIPSSITVQQTNSIANVSLESLCLDSERKKQTNEK